jgi:hypothetical protein
MMAVLYKHVCVGRCSLNAFGSRVIAEAKKMAKDLEYSDQKKPWLESVKEEQQFYYEAFADRDWDCYKKYQVEYLERNVGYAMYGPPKELPDENANGNTGNDC